jgi:phage protein D
MTSEQPTAVYTHYDFYVPAFELKIKGQSLDREVIRDVLSVTYTDSLDRLDSCQITLNNWDAERREFKYLDQENYKSPVTFDPGAEIELSMGYYDRGGLTLMLRGVITSQAPDFPAGGQPTIQVSALSNLYRLHFRQEVAIYEDKTDSAIAQDVVDKIKEQHSSLNLELAPHPAHLLEFPNEFIVINNEYPIIFLMERARRNGYELWLEEHKLDGQGLSILHFEPPDARNRATYELVWGGSLITFKPTLKTKNQVAKITARGWNPNTREQVTGEATWDDLGFRGLPSTEEMGAVDSALAGSEEVVADRPITTEDEAKQVALDHLTRLAKDLVTGAGQTLGLPELRAGRPVFIRGLGKRFSGRYMVTSSTHTIDGNGYSTSFDARMEELK